MARWFFTVESDCTDEAHVDDFNEWYDKIDLSDVLETEGFITATRFECVAEVNDQFDLSRSSQGKGKNLALYEIETDDIDRVIKSLVDTVAKMRNKGRLPPELMKVIKLGRRRIYKKACSLSK